LSPDIIEDARNLRALIGDVDMNKDRIAGAVKEIKGSIKETVGKAAGDAKLEADGRADKLRARPRTLSAVSRTR
jgi:uncharacterized protein YjbJ (UPF0337 family)